VDFAVTPEMLGLYDLSMRRVVEPGRFNVFVGGNARDLLSTSFTFEHQ